MANIENDPDFKSRTLVIKADPFDADEWEDVTASGGRPFIEGAAFEAGERFSSQYGFVFDRADPRIQRWLGERIATFSTEVTETTAKRVRAALIQAQEAGEGIPQIRARMQAIFIEDGDTIRAERGRSNTIARTEMVSATNEGRFDAAVQSEIVVEKEWLTAIDGRERESHRNMHRTRVPLNEPFHVGADQMMAPGGGSIAKENINCRCTFVEIVDLTLEDDDESRSFSGPVRFGMTGEEFKTAFIEAWDERSDDIAVSLKAEALCPDCGMLLGKNVGAADLWCKRCKGEKHFE